MQVLYNGAIIPNGGTVIFPSTVQGSPTNVTLVIMNAGNWPFTISGYGTNGNFVLTNNIWGSPLTVNAGQSTNFGIAFGAVTNGLNFGALEMVTNVFGSNYTVYFEAMTRQTSAGPSIQLVSPLNGATIVDSLLIPVAALVTPGTAPIINGGVSLQFVTTNGLVPMSSGGMSPVLGNYYSADISPMNLSLEGDYTITAMAVDADGQTNIAPPILVHITPYNNPSPVGTPKMNVWLDGTNLSSGSTVVFPQTLPNQPTNAAFLVTNSGTYVLWITNFYINGDFTVSTNVLGPVLAGNSTNFTMTFYADGTGTALGELVLEDNEVDSGVYVLNLVGNAFPPDYIPPSTNSQPPVAVDDVFHVQANSANNILNPLANDYDTNNYPLTIQSVTSSEGGTVVIVNNGSAISYTPPRGIRSETNNGVALPADGFSYTVSDGHGGTAQATVSIIIDASDIPVVTIASPTSPYSTSAGTVVPIIASVAPPENVTKVDFYLDGTQIGELTNGINNAGGFYTNNWMAVFDNDGDQHHQIDVQATDVYGQMGPPGTLQVNISNAGLSGALVASLDSIVDATSTNALSATNLVTIRDGLFNVYGRAYHSLGSNVMWQLGVYTADGSLVRNLTPSTSGAVGSSGASGFFTNCDLTTLMNGVYTLTLSVSGGYQMSSASVQFRLESNLKIGQFGFSQQDLVIPVNGVPLTVTRTYNSINPNKGDFGFGWAYALDSMAVSLDETREDVIDLDGNVFSERSGGSWDVTLTLPNGQTTTFAFCITNADSLGTYQAAWLPAPGVTATLTAQGNLGLETLLSSFTGDPDLVYWDATGPSTPWQQYDFPGFVLKTQDGTQYIISRPDLDDHFVLDGSAEGGGYYVQAYGPPYLSQIIDRNTNTITINPSSISVKSFSGATNQIAFQRNADGLITSVSDPNALALGGSSPPAVQYQYDSSDNLIAVLNLVDRTGAGTYVTNTFSYTNNVFPHYITGIINADGTQVAKNFYDNSGKLIAVQDADGNLTKFIHNLTNNMDVIIDRLGYTNTYVYDPLGNIIAQTNQLGQITLLAYDSNNNKTNTVMFLNGQPYATNSYVYDTNNMMLSSTDPLGHTNGFVYDGFGDVLSSADALGNTTVNVYDGGGNLLYTVDPLGHGSTNFYGDGQMLGSVNAIGTASTNYYDPSTGYLLATATLDASGAILSSNTVTYDADGNRLTSSVWRRVGGTWISATTAYIYDGMDRVVQTINPDGGTNTVVYDSIGKQQATIDPLGNMTSFAYDSQGRLIATTNADLTTDQTFYDANGNRTRSIDRAGRTTSYVYDALNRQVQTVYPDSTMSGTVYDGVGRTAQTLDARGTVTAYAYDVAGRRLAVTNAFGTSIAMTNFYSYDADGNQTTFTDGLGHTTTNVFDVLNRQVQTLYPNETTNSTGYDAVGRRVAMTNQDNVVMLYGYDGAGRLISVTDALNLVTHYQYDEAGNEVAQIDALNRTNLFVYDGMGRRVTHARPDNLTEGFNYDYNGNLINRTNFNYAIIVNQYDALNRLTNSTDNASFGYSYTYTATGRRQSVLDFYYYTTENYAYDNRDRLAQKIVVWTDGPTGVLNYQRDANGNVTAIASGYGNGAQLAYGYDALNRLTNVLSHSQMAANYAYDAVGNLQGMRYGNGETNLYQYDVLNRLTNLVWNDGSLARASFAYQMRAGGTRTNLSEIVNGTSRSYAWSYDSIYRLTNEVVGGLGSLGYGYDAVGNRTNRSGSLGSLGAQTPTYDTNDWLTTDSYDSDGNTVASGAAGFQYDNLDRLIGSSNERTNYTYDADGNRVTKSVYNSALGNVPTYYLVDDQNPSGYAQVLEEYTMDASLSDTPAILSRTYNYGLMLISQQQFNTNTLEPSTLSYYGYDGHGSVRFLTSTNGTVTDTYTYDAYGTLIASSGSTPNNYLYSGQQFDPDLGLYYNRARYLNTSTGRFWSSDSTDGSNEDPLSLHKYLYAQDNPVMGTDPSGHEDLVDVLSTMAINSFIGSMVSSVASTALDRVGYNLLPSWIKDGLLKTATPTPDALEIGASASYNFRAGKSGLSVAPGGGIELLMSPRTREAALYGYGGATFSFDPNKGAGVSGSVGVVFNCPDSGTYTRAFVSYSLPVQTLPATVRNSIDIAFAAASLAGTTLYALNSQISSEQLDEFKSQLNQAAGTINRGSVNIFYDPFGGGAWGISFSVLSNFRSAQPSQSWSVTPSWYFQIAPGHNVGFE